MEATTIIYAGAIFGYLFHIFQEDGYSLAPYWQNGKLQLNMVVSLIIGIVSIIATIQSGAFAAVGATPLELFLSAAALAGGIPFAINTVVTKSTLGNTTTDEEGVA